MAWARTVVDAIQIQKAKDLALDSIAGRYYPNPNSDLEKAEESHTPS